MESVDTRSTEQIISQGVHNVSNGHDMIIDSGESNDAINANENSCSSHYSCSDDHRDNDDDWEDLRRLLSKFHQYIDVELPTLLERVRANAAVMEMNRHYGHDEMSRHHFDLRRCFRNMQELLSKRNLLSLLNDDYFAGGHSDIDFQKRQHCKNIDGDSNTHSPDVADNGDYNNDARLLLKVFVDDLVQLSTIAVFDNTMDNEYYHAFQDAGLRQLHCSVVVLAANRFPMNATLDDDQISRLLSRVLSLIEQESFTIQKQKKLLGKSSHAKNHNQLPSHDFEPLQSLLSWLNREMATDRLSQGVLVDHDEAAMALQIPLEFLDEISTNSIALPSSSTHRPYAILPQQIVLSLRILIDLLLGALNSLVVGGNGESIISQSSDVHASCINSALPLREWMLTTGHQDQHVSLSGSKLESNDHLCLLSLLDRYALELVEETLELLRPQQRKLPPLDFLGVPYGSHTSREQYGLDAGRKRDCHSYGTNDTDSRYQGDSGSYSVCESFPKTTSMRNSTTASKTQNQRVIKVLQYTAMTTNFFSIMEVDSTTISGHTNVTSGKTSIFVGLSRSLWRALARFIIEELDSLDENDEFTINYWEHYNDIDSEVETDCHELEECRLAATDVLFRLTKIQVQAILFHGQNKNIEKNGDIGKENSISKIGSYGTRTTPYRLSEEEFSIIVITILRLLGHPDEYWTAETQAWVATLLQYRGDQINDDRQAISTSSNDTTGVDVASKLRKVLHTTLICTSYLPDALPFEEQCRVNNSLKELLKLSTNNIKPSRRNRKSTSHSSIGSVSTSDATREDVDMMIDDPWESFWSIRQ